MHDGWLFVLPEEHKLNPSKIPCSGASNDKCARCYIEWKPQITSLDKDLLEYLSCYIPLSTQQLHRMWELSLLKYEKKIAREGHKRTLSKEIHLTAVKRRKHMTEFAQSLNVLISPSEYLAEQAVQHNIPKPRLIRHGFPQQKCKSQGRLWLCLLRRNTIT